ncbi:hypothetical protein M422DRAFT_239695, partial [Sphaerobolus stellatus SS14]
MLCYTDERRKTFRRSLSSIVRPGGSKQVTPVSEGLRNQGISDTKEQREEEEKEESQEHLADLLDNPLDDTSSIQVHLSKTHEAMSTIYQPSRVADFISTGVDGASAISPYLVNTMAARAAKNLYNDTSSRIQDYQRMFKVLRDDLDTQTVLYTQAVVVRTERDVLQLNNGILRIEANIGSINQQLEQINATIELNSMTCADGVGFRTDKKCLPETRVALLEEITSWIVNPSEDAPRIFWLYGVAGAGKSAVAHTVGHFLEDVNGLGSFFTFDVSQPGDRRNEKIFRTIARSLADHYPAMKMNLVHAVRNSYDLKTTPDILQQWEKLLIKYITGALNMIGQPVVIIIDALDESGDPDSRIQLLSILANQVQSLPQNFRIPVTSRPLPDIVRSFRERSHIQAKDLGSVPGEGDISLYFHTKLDHIANGFFDPAKIRQLVTRSDGLFQWAYLACEFLTGRKKGGTTPSRQFSKLLSSGTTPGRLQNLDSMYHTILEDAFDTSDEEIIQSFTQLLGLILMANEPLSSQSLVSLIRRATPPTPLEDDLRIADDTLPLRPLHLSFRELLLDPKASGPFCVSAPSAHGDLARISLNIVNQDLRLNICDLDTSYLRDNHIPNLPDRILENIPFSLRYACRAWAIHFSQAPEKPIIDDVIYFFRHKLLYWFEVLALIQGLSSVQEQLLQIITWCKTEEDHLPDLANFAEEGRQFVEAFGNILVEATSHLYLSTLLFTPASSIIATTYAPQFPNIARVTSGNQLTWPVNQGIIQYERSFGVVAFSRDGRYIATGDRSESGFLRIWDAYSQIQLCKVPQ